MNNFPILFLSDFKFTFAIYANDISTYSIYMDIVTEPPILLLIYLSGINLGDKS